MQQQQQPSPQRRRQGAQQSSPSSSGTAERQGFRDRYDPANAKYFEAIRQREIEQQKEQERPSYMRRKLNRMFGGVSDTGRRFVIGFGQGSMVGAVIGVVTGIYIGVRTRRLSLFLMSAFGSAISFGFIMGVGAIIRSESVRPDTTPVQGGNWLLARKGFKKDSPTI